MLIKFITIHLEGAGQTKDEIKTLDPWCTVPCTCADNDKDPAIPRWSVLLVAVDFSVSQRQAHAKQHRTRSENCRRLWI